MDQRRVTKVTCGEMCSEMYLDKILRCQNQKEFRKIVTVQVVQ